MTKRRGNNEGSIYKRPDGKWAGQVSIGFNPDTGKPVRKTFYATTRKEVADKVARAVREASSGSYIEPTTITLGEWLTKWLAVHKKNQLKAGTLESYETLIRTHIAPTLGKVPMAKLQPHMLQSFYNEKLADGRCDGKGGLSTRTVRYLHVIVQQALSQAVKEGLLTRNVATATSPPTVQTKQMRPLTEAELLDFLEKAKDDRLFAAYLLAATTGLRRGELLGLCWDCVNLDAGTVTIQRQLLALDSGLVLEESTKTQSGRRTIALTDDAVRELKAHRRRQAQERLLAGAAYQSRNLLFCKEDGGALAPKQFTKSFQLWLAKANLPKARLHDLRHTHATLLLSRGIPAKLVQERLGHSSITMTLDLYSHVTPEMQKLAAESMNGLLSKRKDPAKAQGERV